MKLKTNSARIAGFGCALVLAIWLGTGFGLGWLGFVLYRHYAPEHFTEIGLWPWFGLGFAALVLLSSGSRASAS